MSHYYEQELKKQQELKEWETFFKKKATVRENIPSGGVCPPGSYLCPEEVVIQDSEIENSESKPLKDTAGKPEGARYCFLTDIGSTIDHQYSHIGKHLGAIVREQDNDNPQASMYIIENLLPTLIDSSNVGELIGVRADALASGKYVTESYREKIDVNLLLDAAARHYLKLLFVENIDEESGYPHIAHITANLIIIHTQLRLHHD